MEKSNFEIGQEKYMASEYEEAKRYFQLSIDDNKYVEGSYDGMGECFRMQGNYQEAKTWYQFAIDRKNDWERPYWGMGDCFRMQKNYEKAKTYYQLAIDRNDKFATPYFSLSQLPADTFNDTEPVGIPYFFRFLLLWPQSQDAKAGQVITRALTYDAPLMVTHFIQLLHHDEPDLLYTFAELHEIFAVTKPFRTQFALWKDSRQTPTASLTMEALMNYYLGNSIRCYEVYDSEMEDTLECPLSLMNNYYFALSAYNIMEDHAGCLKAIVLPQAEQTAADENASQTDQYYAALIFDLLEMTAEAQTVLSKLDAAGFTPARYKLAELSKKDYVTDDAYLEAEIGRLSGQFNLDYSYFRFPDRIVVKDSEEAQLAALMPLIHYMENKEVLEALYLYQQAAAGGGTGFNKKGNPFDQRFFFASKIIFDHLESEKMFFYVKENNPEKHRLVFGSEDELESLENEIDFFRKEKEAGRNIARKLGDEVHVFSLTRYYYYKNKIDDNPPEFNFRHHLILTTNLLEQQILSNEEAGLLQEYIKYCAEKIYDVNPENEALQWGFDEMKSLLYATVEIGIGLEKVERAARFALNKITLKQSELISFSAFKEAVQRKAVDAGNSDE